MTSGGWDAASGRTCNYRSKKWRKSKTTELYFTLLILMLAYAGCWKLCLLIKVFHLSGPDSKCPSATERHLITMLFCRHLQLDWSGLGYNGTEEGHDETGGMQACTPSTCTNIVKEVADTTIAEPQLSASEPQIICSKLRQRNLRGTFWPPLFKSQIVWVKPGCLLALDGVF